MDDNRCSNSFSFIIAKSSSIPRDNNDEDEGEAAYPYLSVRHLFRILADLDLEKQPHPLLKLWK